MDSEEQAVPVLLNVLSDILLIKVNLSNNFFQCICTLLKLFDLSFCHSHWNFALYTIWSYQSNIHAYVFGEHGDTSFIPWSGAYISGVSVDEYYDLEKKLGKDIEPIDKEAMLQYVQKSGGEIISKKGATFYAVSSSVCKLCSLLVSSSESISTVSTMMHGSPEIFVNT